MSTTTVTTNDRTPAQRAVANHLRLLTSSRLMEWVGLFAPDGVMTFPFAPDGMAGEVKGHDAMLEHMSNFPDTFEVRFVDLDFHETTDPHLAIAEFRLTGTALPTGKSYEQTCVSIVRTNADGLITRYDDYWNPLAAIAALQSEPVAEPGTSGVAESFGS